MAYNNQLSTQCPFDADSASSIWFIMLKSQSQRLCDKVHEENLEVLKSGFDPVTSRRKQEVGSMKIGLERWKGDPASLCGGCMVEGFVEVENLWPGDNTDRHRGLIPSIQRCPTGWITTCH